MSQKTFFNDPKCQKRGFLGLGLVDRLDISYYDKTKCFPAFGNSTRSWRIIQKSLKGQIWNQSLTQNAWEEMIAFWKVLEVEEVTWSPEVETSPARTLQFSTSVELEPLFVSVLVSQAEISVTASWIFTKLGQKLEDNNRRKITRPDFPGKIWIIQ